MSQSLNALKKFSARTSDIAATPFDGSRSEKRVPKPTFVSNVSSPQYSVAGVDERHLETVADKGTCDIKPPSNRDAMRRD